MSEYTNDENINNGSASETGVETIKIVADQSANTENQKPKSLKEIVDDGIKFVETKILTPKICKIIELCFNILLLLLGVVQALIWGLKLSETYKVYVDTILNKDYVGIAIIAIEVLFVIAFIYNIIKGIVELIKRNKEPQFETLTTLYAFYVFSMMLKHIFHGKQPLISSFTFKPIMTIMIVLLVCYAVVRLFSNDFMSRIVPLIFSGAGVILARFMFNGNIGNFAGYTFNGSEEISLANLNSLKYITTAISVMKGGGESIWDMTFLGSANEFAMIVGGVSIDELQGSVEGLTAIVLLQLIPILVENIIPFAALTAIGYLMYCFTSSNYMQYYKLEICRKLSVNMLWMAIFSIVFTVGAHFIYKLTDSAFAVNLNIANMVMTMITIIGMIIVSSTPWKLYSNFHIKRHQKQLKTEGGR